MEFMKSVALVLLLSLGLLFQRGCGYCRWHTRQSYTSLAVKKCSEHSKPEAIPEIFNGSPISYKSLTHNSIQKFCRAIASTSILPLVLTNLPQRASAEEITTIDEGAAVEFAKQLESSRGLNSDEFIIEFSNENLGLKLGETSYKGFPIVSVKDIKDPFLLQNHPELKIDAIVVAVNGLKTDGLPLKLIADTIKGSTRPVYIKFRDPNRFFELLDSTAGPPLRKITTTYLPANTRDPGSQEQIISVERLAMPPPELRTRKSQMLDVMEIQYVAQIQGDESGRIVDSSAERSAPGTSAKSIFYVLGQRNGPAGFPIPPGWDLTLLGMVPGEKRRILIPYTLAYDRKGLKSNNIPPYANMVYTVKLLSLT